MEKPKHLLLKCKFCGYQWLEPIESIVDEIEITYRADGEPVVETTERRIPCKNPGGCPHAVIVTVPVAWTRDDEDAS
ncbi:MAG: hypothetical protein M9941_02255 [Anaerolineae bacterium]|nr:hypothetical protein [Anaerolineae bacterium]